MKKSMTFDGLCHKAQTYVKNNSATILTVIGAIGVIGTAISAAKASPKAIDRLCDAENEKQEELTKWETFIFAAPAYVPTAFIAGSTIACIFGANIINKRRQAALTSAYMLLDKSFKEYRERLRQMYGTEVDENVRREIMEVDRDEYEIEYHQPNEEKILFYETVSQRYFESTVEEVQRAEYHVNRELVMNDEVNINVLFKALGLTPTPEGEVLGWSTYAGYEKYGYSWIDFKHDRIILDDGLECVVIGYPYEPAIDYRDF